MTSPNCNAGSDPLNALDKPGFVVKIYTAAEVEFASEVGKKYQVQSVSDITGTLVERRLRHQRHR